MKSEEERFENFSEVNKQGHAIFPYSRGVISAISSISQDYGITERGGKTNSGNPELNTSSIGMAKVSEAYYDCFISFLENCVN